MTSIKALVCVSWIALCMMACERKPVTGEDLTEMDLEELRELGLLDDTETIFMFDTQGGWGGIETSGNFFSDKRIAAYWLDDEDSAKSFLDFAYYADIDTITTTDRSQSATYASFLEVTKLNGQRFKVYVDADSETVHEFFDGALSEWREHRGS